MTILFAQPYNICANGFYFESADEYKAKSTKARDDFGEPVEEFEIQFIDGDAIDCALAKAIGLNQTNALRFLEIVDDWSEEDKILFIIGVGECGISFDLDKDAPESIEIDLYPFDTITELAEQFVEDGLFGEIPDNLRFYVDIKAIARDLSVEYAATEIAGRRFVYACR